MTGYHTILVPTDFSPFSQNAIRYAHAFAKASGGRIHFVHVVDERYARAGCGVYGSFAAIDTMMKEMEGHAGKQMGLLVGKASAMGIDAEQHVLKGVPVEEIVLLAETLKADLIVTATHGHSGFDRMVLGSTCEKLIRQSVAPVLAVKAEEHDFVNKFGETIALKKVLCPCDFSEFSQGAVPIAAGLCAAFGATLMLAHVVDTWLDYPELMPNSGLSDTPHLADEARASLEQLAKRQSGIEVKVIVRSGIPHRVLAEIIEREKIDLAVMMTHGRSGLPHFLLGSVAEKVVRAAGCPVMTVRPKE